jgi:hypothetical protein
MPICIKYLLFLFDGGFKVVEPYLSEFMSKLALNPFTLRNFLLGIGRGGFPIEPLLFSGEKSFGIVNSTLFSKYFPPLDSYKSSKVLDEPTILFLFFFLYFDGFIFYYRFLINSILQKCSFT